LIADSADHGINMGFGERNIPEAIDIVHRLNGQKEGPLTGT
jgi:hypothetical protein